MEFTQARSCRSEHCWNSIVQGLPGRTSKSYGRRWIHSLDPSFRRGITTLIASVSGGAMKRLSSRTSVNVEDIQSVKAVKRHGRQCHEVGNLLPSRTDHQCAKPRHAKLSPSIHERCNGRTTYLVQYLAPHSIVSVSWAGGAAEGMLWARGETPVHCTQSETPERRRGGVGELHEQVL